MVVDTEAPLGKTVDGLQWQVLPQPLDTLFAKVVVVVETLPVADAIENPERERIDVGDSSAVASCPVHQHIHSPYPVAGRLPALTYSVVNSSENANKSPAKPQNIRDCTEAYTTPYTQRKKQNTT